MSILDRFFTKPQPQPQLVEVPKAAKPEKAAPAEPPKATLVKATTEVLEPPPPVRDPMRPQDRFIAQCTNIARMEEGNPYANCANASDRLLKYLEIADREGGKGRGDFLLSTKV